VRTIHLVLLVLLALPLAACKKAEPVVAAKPAPVAKAKKAGRSRMDMTIDLRNALQ